MKKHYLIKLNSDDLRKKGYTWVLLEYESRYSLDKDSDFRAIDAKHIELKSPTETYTKNNTQHFILAFGELTVATNGMVVIE